MMLLQLQSLGLTVKLQIQNYILMDTYYTGKTDLHRPKVVVSSYT